MHWCLCAVTSTCGVCWYSSNLCPFPYPLPLPHSETLRQAIFFTLNLRLCPKRERESGTKPLSTLKTIKPEKRWRLSGVSFWIVWVFPIDLEGNDARTTTLKYAKELSKDHLLGTPRQMSPFTVPLPPPPYFSAGLVLTLWNRMGKMLLEALWGCVWINLSWIENIEAEMHCTFVPSP